MKYRVIYYTEQGIKSKDFDARKDAEDFRDRHIKKHPEYQSHEWSKTELVVIAADRQAVYNLVFTSDELKALHYVLDDVIDIYADNAENDECDNKEWLRKCSELLRQIKDKIPEVDAQ